MAVQQTWVKVITIALSLSLLLFTLAQLALDCLLIVYYYTGAITFGGVSYSISNAVALAAVVFLPGAELASIAALLTPTIWLGFAAAMSRHRGVYIMLSVLSCLAFLDAIGFTAASADIFSRSGYLTHSSTMVQGAAISKIVLWAFTMVLLLGLTVVAIAASCLGSRKPRYQPGGYSDRMMAPPPQYSLQQYQPKYSSPRAAEAPPNRYFDYGRPSGDRYYH